MTTAVLVHSRKYSNVASALRIFALLVSVYSVTRSMRVGVLFHTHLLRNVIWSPLERRLFLFAWGSVTCGVKQVVNSKKDEGGFARQPQKRYSLLKLNKLLSPQPLHG